MSLKPLRFNNGRSRKEKLLLITYYFLIGTCFLLAVIDVVNARPTQFALYNFGFCLLFGGLYLLSRKRLEQYLLFIVIFFHVFIFIHAYFLNPGTQAEAAFGLIICIAPLFYRGASLWIIFLVNFVLFHICLLHADYDKFFNGLYFLYIIAFWVIKTLVRENERFEEDLVKSKRQVEKNAAQLEQAYAFKTRFFINITHELRTPLTLIISPIRSLLQKQKTADQDKELLEVVDKNAHLLMSRVNQLLELAKIDRNEVSIHKEYFDIGQLIQALKNQFLPLAHTKKIELLTESPDERHLSLYSDQVKIEMILSNLISNALKFTDIGGKVTMSCQDAGDYLQISVRDNGIGIPEAERTKIFDRFYQVERPDYHEGTGVGLALSEELVEKLGGEIWVEGNVDQGCTFFVKMPKGAEKEVAVEEHIATSLPDIPLLEGRKPTLLLVEDNEDLNRYMQLLLRTSYQVLSAYNGQEALEILEQLHGNQTTPDLIITDLMMPVMNGQELIKKLKLDDRFVKIPTIVITALSEIGIKLDLIRIGIDDYLTKPFFENELLTIVEKHLPVGSDAEAPTEEPIRVLDMEWLKKVEDILLERVGDSAFTLQKLATELFMSPRTMQLKIKQLTGKTPKQYQRAIILQYARDRIQSGEFDTVNLAANSVGFEDQHYFSTLYKKHFGITPKDDINRVKT